MFNPNERWVAIMPEAWRVYCRTHDISGLARLTLEELILMVHHKRHDITITQTELAKEIGVGRNTIPRVMAQLADCGAVTVDFAAGGQGYVRVLIYDEIVKEFAAQRQPAAKVARVNQREEWSEHASSSAGLALTDAGLAPEGADHARSDASDQGKGPPTTTSDKETGGADGWDRWADGAKAARTIKRNRPSLRERST